MKNCLNYFLLILFTQSCVVINLTNEKDTDICKMHNRKMQKTIVKTSFGELQPISNVTTYPNTKTKKNLGCVVPIWPTKRLAKIYYCNTCDSLAKL